MNDIRMQALDGSDPLGLLAAIGVLRIVARTQPSARLHWIKDGSFAAVLSIPEPVAIVELLLDDVERWRTGHAAIDFALGADRKAQDLKHPPDAFRTLLKNLRDDVEAAEFGAAYGTGVAVDGSGQSKPTSLHFTAGQQRFMDAIVNLRNEVTRADLEEALFGPWVGRPEPKDTRWRAASDRSRALLSFDPGKEPGKTVAGAAWLAFQALPLFPVVPSGLRAITTGFTGRGKSEQFTWPVWSAPLSIHEVRTLLGMAALDRMQAVERKARGIFAVLRSDVVRSAQGYGNFAASRPL